MSFEPQVDEGCILDACSLINLAVMPCGGRLLRDLPNAFHVPERVIYEVVGVRRPHQERRKALLRHTARACLAHAAEFEMFGDLVSREGRRALGDGEAAAMAVGHSRGLLVITDDGPARKVLTDEMAQRHCTSVGLLRAGLRVGVLSDTDVHYGLSAGLAEARMTVLDCDLVWVREVLGECALVEHRQLGDVPRRLATIRLR